ncbi:polysaccharide deacetylase [Pseudopedobacter saltans DSM 12145]|uniref:Polysaccharide deacetylase n=1 Tax=Pseudopedobacter saltans (strain ATCC 51119 / DSM 12145 / JCM 21818 / CCUG 39354 / LMG 10337 / NBRC 100064 / NCIMB 13643) TaxID=762903 RepID=F0SD30_PSESL|nr:polysaccharide deacetylase family protein [Pseudopedobacter saltans]ADY51787.1 polysaccharide deacetylase [Pseudopedobacter saltans DSM 12145]
MFNDKIVSVFSSVVPDLLFERLIERHKLVTFLYHVVSNKELPHIRHLYKYKSEAQFEKDLDVLLKYYDPFDLSGGFENLSFKSKKPLMILTFDDGLRECYEVVAPILKRKGISAIFFINSGFVDNKSLFYRFKVSLIIENIKSNFPNHIHEFVNQNLHQSIVYLKSLNYNQTDIIDSILKQLSIDSDDFLDQHKPYMSKEQILDLKNMGFSIGAHSIDHPDFKNISLGEQIRQVKESVDYIKEEIGVDYKYFAFPFSEKGADNLVYNLAKERVVDMFFGTSGFNRNGDNYFLQQRISMEFDNIPLERFLKMRYTVYLIKHFLG